MMKKVKESQMAMLKVQNRVARLEIFGLKIALLALF